MSSMMIEGQSGGSRANDYCPNPGGVLIARDLRILSIFFPSFGVMLAVARSRNRGGDDHRGN